MYVKPIDGLKVVDLEGKYLEPEGREVPEISYWFRRLRDKSVVLGSAPVGKDEESKTKKEKPEGGEEAKGEPTSEGEAGQKKAKKK
jgi:hypothetical protein